MFCCQPSYVFYIPSFFFKCLSITWFFAFHSFTSLVCLFLSVILHHTSFPGTQCPLWLKIQSSRAFSSSTVKRINVNMVIIIFSITILIINNIVERIVFLFDQFFSARTVSHVPELSTFKSYLFTCVHKSLILFTFSPTMFFVFKLLM